jgi:isopentenyl-diphosphate delta-isomerase
MDTQQVILVDTNDKEIGIGEKMSVHRQGILHRAFSIFVLNEKNEMLLQQRALTKYHSPGLWSNTCCSHPMPNETLEQAVTRRLHEEMGFSCPIQKVFHFIYKEHLDNDLIEHEFDHVFLGIHRSADIHINQQEVANYGYFSIDAINTWLQKTPDEFTCWFRIAFPKICGYINNS